MTMFRPLTDQEIVEFCEDTVKLYPPISDQIKSFWHPVVQLKCVLINLNSVCDNSSDEYDKLLQNMMKVLLTEHENVLLRQRDKELISK